MQRRLFLGGTALALIAGGAYFYNNQFQTTGPGIGSVSAQEASNIDTSGIAEMAMGDENAPITMIEYASFTCPHCANFHKNTFPQLKADYIDTGKVRFIYREVYFDRFGLWAGMLARCGGEMRYFGISEMLYHRQREWLEGGEPETIVNNLRTIGRAAGMSDDQMNACLNDGDTAQAMVALYQKNAAADDINSTPSFVIDGTKYNNMGYDEFRAILDEKLAG